MIRIPGAVKLRFLGKKLSWRKYRDKDGGMRCYYGNTKVELFQLGVGGKWVARLRPPYHVQGETPQEALDLLEERIS